MNILTKVIKEAKALDDAITEVYRAPEHIKPTPSKSIYALNLYITLDDLNDYIHNKVDERFKDATFIPFAVECNSNDLSIEITLLSPDVSDDCGSCRYRLDLNAIADKKTFERGLRAKTNIIDETFSPCSECAHEDWDMPQCKECNATNNFKYFEGWENNND